MALREGAMGATGVSELATVSTEMILIFLMPPQANVMIQSDQRCCGSDSVAGS